MLDLTGDFLSRFGSILQIGVDLVEPVPIGQHIGGHHTRCHHLSIPQPRQADVFGIKVVRAANEDGWMSAARCLI